LPALATDLVSRKVDVLVAMANAAALAAKAVTTTIPVVFAIGGDPVKLGLVESLNRPSGNITGVSFFLTQLESKRLGLLHELVPHATEIAVLINPTQPVSSDQVNEVKEAARALGLTRSRLGRRRDRERVAVTNSSARDALPLDLIAA
jgi:putative ABC transport system substrate-binding protein